jgi:hypothetical protein
LDLNYIGRYYDTDHNFQAEFRKDLESHLADLSRGEVRIPALSRLLATLIRDETLHVLATENLLRPASAGSLLEAMTHASQTAPPGKLGVLLTIRRQTDLLVSRYLHDLNTKHPAIGGSSLVGRAVQRLRRSGPPYTLFSALDPANPPCQWPYCKRSVGPCPCAKNGHIVSITPDFYDFFSHLEALQGAIPEDRIVVADLVDPELRPPGIARFCQLLSALGGDATPEAVAVHFETPVNAQHGLAVGGFARENLDSGELAKARRMIHEHYLASNQGLAGVFPEFSSYLGFREG